MLFQGQDAWFATSLWAWILRILSALFLPRYFYARIVAPVLFYATRATPLAFYLAFGPHKPLNPAAAHFLFRVQAVGDAFLSLTQPVVHVGIDVAFNILSIAAAAVLVAWHGRRHSDLQVNFGHQILWRIGMSGLAHVLSRYLRRPRLAAAPSAMAYSLTKVVKAPALAIPCGCRPLPTHPSQPRSAGGEGSDSPDRTLHDCALAAQGAHLSARHAAMATTPGSQQNDDSVNDVPPAVKALGTLRDSVAGVYRSRPLGTPPPYRSPVRRYTARVKIPFAEPEQLGPGYLERLQQMSAERGMQLTAVYVRAGCIEVLMDTALWPEAPLTDNVGNNLRQLLADAAAASAGVDSSAAAGSAAPPWELDLDAFMEALQLQPAPPGRPAPTANQQALAQSSVPLGGAAPADGRADQGRILSMQPRVLTLPPPPRRLWRRAARPTGVNLAVRVALPGPLGAPEQLPLEVLVRSGGAYLRAAATQVSSVAGTEEAVAGSEAVYDLELLELPANACTLLVEFRWGGRLARAAPLLMLPPGCADGGAVAEELEALAASWSASGAEDQVGDVLLDLGTLLEAHRKGAQGATAGMAVMAGSDGLPPRVAALREHMLRFAEEAQLTATAKLLRSMAAPASGRGGGGGEGSGAAAAAAARAARRGRSLLLSSLALAVGWERCDEAEEAAYQVYAAPLVLAQGHVIQAAEVAMLFALLFRARHDLLSPSNLTSLAGCCVGTATALAWPLLPRRRWAALVDAAKIPRYLAYMAAKLMIAFLGFPAPPGIVPYQLGPAMLVMEGLLLPGSCLLSLRATLLMTLIKWPLGVRMALQSGATDDPLHAGLLCGRVALLALATTLACHTYLRLSYARRAAAEAAARGVHKGAVGVADKAKAE